MRSCLLLLLSVALGGCATQAPPPRMPTLLRDQAFLPATEPVADVDVFALSEDMRRYLHTDIARDLRDEGPARGLLNALQRHDRLRLDYDTEQTRTAAQAFAARKGNCLSLVIMTAALAKELGLHVSYKTVADEDTWSRADDLAIHSLHVNVTLEASAMSAPGLLERGPTWTVDFVPPELIPVKHTHTVSEETIVAMYWNNRAAESLALGRIDEAYWRVRAAILRTPDYLAPYNTLAIIYLRHGDVRDAGTVLRALVQRDPRNISALSNLLIVAQRLGDLELAARLRARLAQLDPEPPFAFYFQGQQALQRGDFLTAKALFAREVDRADYSSEFHFWLGIANLRLGDVDEARRQVALAVEYSTTESAHALYAAKLGRLLSYGLH